MSRLISTLILVCVCDCLSGAGAPPLVTAVFVTTNVQTPGDPLTTETERIDLAESIKIGLPSNKRISSQVTLAPNRESANVTVDVIRADLLESTMFLPHDMQSVALAYSAVVRLNFGSYSTQFWASATKKPYRRPVTMLTEWDPEAIPRIKEMRQKVARSLSTDIREWISGNDVELRRGTPY